MATIKAQITENDYIELTRSVGSWPAGTHGTAVSDHGASTLVEISDGQGQMLDLIEIDESDLRLISKHSADPVDL